jgi:hypothetical protein
MPARRYFARLAYRNANELAIAAVSAERSKAGDPDERCSQPGNAPTGTAWAELFVMKASVAIETTADEKIGGIFNFKL